MVFLVGMQGFLGWYMVKSGLEDSLMEKEGAVPRVSQYRLAAHLGTALVLYVGMLGSGVGVLRDWRYARGGGWSGVSGERWKDVLGHPRVMMFKRLSWGLAGLVFLTALSGTKFVPPSYCFIDFSFMCGLFRCVRGGSRCRIIIQ